MNKYGKNNLRKMIPRWYNLDGNAAFPSCVMNTYGIGNRDSRTPIEICGEYACGVGVCTLFIPPIASDYRIEDFDPELHIGVKEKPFSFEAYQERIFPEMAHDEYLWLFDSQWGAIDPTYRGVALRANYFLKNRATPDNFSQPSLFNPYIFKHNRELIQ